MRWSSLFTASSFSIRRWCSRILDIVASSFVQKERAARRRPRECVRWRTQAASYGQQKTRAASGAGRNFPYLISPFSTAARVAQEKAAENLQEKYRRRRKIVFRAR